MSEGWKYNSTCKQHRSERTEGLLCKQCTYIIVRVAQMFIKIGFAVLVDIVHNAPGLPAYLHCPSFPSLAVSTESEDWRGRTVREDKKRPILFKLTSCVLSA